MHHNTSFAKLTKKGQVRKVVREHYLRDDIWSGSPLDPQCPATAQRLSASAPHYLLIDTNVALHQIDLLENAAVDDVIVCSVVLDEVQHKNVSAYQRLRALTSSPQRRFFVFANEHHRETFVGPPRAGESPNDRNDRAIRAAAKWYSERLQPAGMQVLLLTNDAASRRLAVSEGLAAMGVAAYARSRRAAAPQLMDLVARPGGGGGGDSDDEEGEEDGEEEVEEQRRLQLFSLTQRELPNDEPHDDGEGLAEDGLVSFTEHL